MPLTMSLRFYNIKNKGGNLVKKHKFIILAFLLLTIPLISTNNNYVTSNDDNLIDLKNVTFDSSDL